MSFMMPNLPKPPAPPPPFGMIQGQRPARKPMSPTFLGADVTPQGSPTATSGGTTGKTLLGQ